MLLTELLPRAAAEYPEKLAVSCGSMRMSYRQVAESVSRLAAALADRRVKRGERVAILHRNCHRMLEAYFGAAASERAGRFAVHKAALNLLAAGRSVRRLRALRVLVLSLPRPRRRTS